MRRTVIHLFVLVLASSSLFAQAKKPARPAHKPAEATAEQKQQFADDQEAINTLHDRDIKASMSLDEPALEALWTDDIVTMHPGGPAVVGKAANIARLQEGIEQMKAQEVMAYDEEFKEVRILGDWAYEWGTITGRTKPFSGGEETSYRFNIVRVLKREPDGSWKIARSIYNNAEGAPVKAPEAPKPAADDKNKLKD